MRALASLVLLASLSASPKVLLTGFVPFDHKSDNPSGDIAKSLNGTCYNGTCFDSLLLSVDAAGAGVVATLLNKTNSSGGYAAVLHIGEDIPGMFEQVTHVHLELVAANTVARSAGGDDSIIPGAQAFLPTTARLDAGLFATVAEHSDTMMWHRDAGTYFCNDAYFQTLYAIRERNIIAPGASSASASDLLPAMFVHVPPTKTMPVAQSQALVLAVATKLVLRNAVAEDEEEAQQDVQPRRGSAADVVESDAIDSIHEVLLVGFRGRLGPDRSGAAVLALNGTTQAVACPSPANRSSTTTTLHFSAIVLNIDATTSAEAVATLLARHPGAYSAVLHTAESQDRLQPRDVQLQTVGYQSRAHTSAMTRLARGEGEEVRPSTFDLGRVNPSVRAKSTTAMPPTPLSPLPSHGDSVVRHESSEQQHFSWRRVNDAVDRAPGAAYFATLGAATGNLTTTTTATKTTPTPQTPTTPTPVLLAFLPFERQTPSQDRDSLQATLKLLGHSLC